MAKTKKSEIKMEVDGFNNSPSRSEILKHLSGLDGFRFVDVDEEVKSYWKNDRDTLVFEIDGDELYRFGGDVIARTMDRINTFTRESNPDEFDTFRIGARTIYRFWWD